jgi:hypothetical protein
MSKPPNNEDFYFSETWPLHLPQINLITMDVKGAEKDTLLAFMDGPFLQWVRKKVIFNAITITFVNFLLVRGRKRL